MHILKSDIAKNIRIVLTCIAILSQSVIPEAFAFESELSNKLVKSDQPVIVKGDKVEYFREQKK